MILGCKSFTIHAYCSIMIQQCLFSRILYLWLHWGGACPSEGWFWPGFSPRFFRWEPQIISLCPGFFPWCNCMSPNIYIYIYISMNVLFKVSVTFLHGLSLIVYVPTVMHQFWYQYQNIQVLINIIDARDAFLHAHDPYQNNKGAHDSFPSIT